MPTHNSHENHRAPGPVSLVRFLELYGEHHRAEIDALWHSPGTDYLVLFAGAGGSGAAILTVGAAHDYKRLDEAAALEIDGLRAVCHTPAIDAYRAGIAAKSWHLEDADRRIIAEHCPESAESLAQAIRDGRAAGMSPVRAALSHIALHARDLALRERYVVESENKLADRAQALVERAVELDQREADLAAFERKAKGSGIPFECAVTEFPRAALSR